MRLVPENTSTYRVDRRSLMRQAGIAAYSVPAIVASLNFASHKALAKGDELVSAPVNETIIPRDDKPKAVVGEGFEVIDQDGDGFELVTVDGSASVDSDGPIASFTWSLKDEVVAETAVATVSLPVGTHRLVLTVADSGGNTDSAKIRIRVKRGPETSTEPTEEAVAPQPPYDVRVEQEKADLVIRWRDQQNTPRPIRIYRVVDDLQVRRIDERDWELLSEVQDDSDYRDQTYTPGTNYLIALRSFDGVSESEWSNVVAITPQEYVEETDPEPTEPPVDEPTSAPPPTEIPVSPPTETPVPETPDEPPADVPPTDSGEADAEVDAPAD